MSDEKEPPIEKLGLIIKTTEEDHHFVLNNGDTLDISQKNSEKTDMRIHLLDGVLVIKSAELAKKEDAEEAEKPDLCPNCGGKMIDHGTGSACSNCGFLDVN